MLQAKDRPQDIKSLLFDKVKVEDGEYTGVLKAKMTDGSVIEFDLGVRFSYLDALCIAESLKVDMLVKKF